VVFVILKSSHMLKTEHNVEEIEPFLCILSYYFIKIDLNLGEKAVIKQLLCRYFACKFKEEINTDKFG